MTSCIPWSPGTRWRKLKGAYSFSLSHDKSSSTGWIHTVHSGADRQPKTKVKRTLSPPQWAQIPHWRRQTRIFHWRTTASMAQLYNIFQSWFLAMNHHDLFDRLLSLAFVFQVWMKTIPKSNSASTLLPDSGMPLSAERIWVFFRFLHRLCFSFSIIWQRDYDDKETEEFMTSCRMSLIRHRRRTLLLCKET